MLSCRVDHQVVTSFDRCMAGIYEDGEDVCMQDGGVYVFDCDITMDGSALIGSLSDDHLVVYDPSTMVLVRKIKAHAKTINGFDLSKTSPNIVFTASSDRQVCGWDLRVPGDQPVVVKMKLPEEVTAVSLGVSDSLLAVGCETAILFYDVRSHLWSSSSSFGSSSSNGTSSKPKKLGQYADIHTDIVTQLRFSKAKTHILVSGAEDGLVTIFDTSAEAGDDAVVSILNTECPVRRLGFFGNDDEALYCLSTVETATFWHCASAQRVCHFSTVREQLGVDYLVDCLYDGISDTLCLLGGDFNGGGALAVVNPGSLAVCGRLSSGQGAHSAQIRCAKHWNVPVAVGLSGSSSSSSSSSRSSSTSTSSSSGSSSSNCSQMGTRLFTGGEDARICSWFLAPTMVDNNGSGRDVDGRSGRANVTDARETIGGGGGGGGGGEICGGDRSNHHHQHRAPNAEKNRHERRQKPY